jgi:hypothetical protein
MFQTLRHLNTNSAQERYNALRQGQEAHWEPTLARTPRASARPPGRPSRPGIIHTSLYLPEALYEALREAAFRERRKIHDIVLEGIRLALGKRGRKQ